MTNRGVIQQKILNPVTIHGVSRLKSRNRVTGRGVTQTESRKEAHGVIIVLVPDLVGTGTTIAGPDEGIGARHHDYPLLIDMQTGLVIHRSLSKLLAGLNILLLLHRLIGISL